MMPEWLPIETAPKDGSVFWCYDKKPSIDYGYDQHRCFWNGERFEAMDDSNTDPLDINPTHWMPIPKDPVMT